MKKITILAHNHPDILTEPLDTTNLQFYYGYQNFIPELLQSTKVKVNLIEGDFKDVDDDAMIIYIPVYDLYCESKYSKGSKMIKAYFNNLPEDIIRRTFLANKNDGVKVVLTYRIRYNTLQFDLAGCITDGIMRGNHASVFGYKEVGEKINAVLGKQIYDSSNIVSLDSTQYVTLAPFLLEYIDAYMDMYL